MAAYPLCQIHCTGCPKSCILVPGERGAAASLNYPMQETGDQPFHQCHSDKMRHGGAHQASASPCQETSSPPSLKVDPIWKMRRWLEQCEAKVDDAEWQPLACPLMDGSDAAVCTLVLRLLAAWHWMVETLRPLICPPAPTILNIRHFLDKDVEGHGWDTQEWMEAYACTLQCSAEAAEGRCLTPNGNDFFPRFPLLVEAFTSKLKVEILPASAVNCWDHLPVYIPHQRDEGPLAHVISYLDDKATHLPMHKAWDELVWLPPSSAPPRPKRSESVGYIQGQMVELGPMIPPVQFHISNPTGEFIFLQGDSSMRALSLHMTP